MKIFHFSGDEKDKKDYGTQKQKTMELVQMFLFKNKITPTR